MIDPISGVADAPLNLLTNEVPGGTLGKDEFLELLIAQLQNQDPLSPMEADQLAVQLAQFSSVEQLISINEQIGSLGASDAALADTVSTSTAVGLIGKNVRAVVDRISLDGTGSTSIDVLAPSGGGQATVHVYDPAGFEVATYDGGSLSSGQQSISLAALDQQLPPGTYGIAVELSDSLGNSVQVPATMAGLVSGVRYDAGGPMLAIGINEFALSAVVEVTN